MIMKFGPDTVLLHSLLVRLACVRIVQNVVKAVNVSFIC